MSSDWFYHAPHKKKTGGEPPAIPPMSQVPGLSDLPAEYKPEKPPGVLIRETDSKYTKLAKMGGRKNLLYFKQGVPSNEPKKYPIPEWWGFKPTDGLQDETTLAQPRAKPSVPDYMVYQPHYATTDTLIPPSRARVPFGQDGQSHWSRDPNNIRAPHTNIVIQKQKRTLEPIEFRASRNVGQEKPAGVVIQSRAQTAKEKPTNSFTPELPIRMKTFIANREVEQANLSKILNYGYQRDWLEEREQSRKIDEEKRRLYSHNLRKTLTKKGYNIAEQDAKQSNVDKSASKHHSPSPGDSKLPHSAKKSVDVPASPLKPWKTTSKTAHHGPVATDSLYKMKRFENIPSRVNVPPIQEVH